MNALPTSARARVVPETEDDMSSVYTDAGLAGRVGPLLPGTGRWEEGPAEAPADADS